MEVNTTITQNNAVFETAKRVAASTAETTAETTRQAKKSVEGKSANASDVRFVDVVFTNDDFNTPQKPTEAEYEGSGSYEILDHAIAEANKKLSGFNREASYSVHEVTKDIMIKIVDTETHEVVREIPPKANLDAVAKMWELAGILIDELK